jgi:3-oxoadipate CoA-transferase alpha subunit
LPTDNADHGNASGPDLSSIRERQMSRTVTFAPDPDAAVAGVRSGSTVLVGGFGIVGEPTELIDALRRTGVDDLTIVSNNAGNGDRGLAALLAAGQVAKVVCSYPRQRDSHVFDLLYRAGRIELELVPQGTLAERIRAAAAGIGGFYTPTAVGTELARGKEVRTIDGRTYCLELPIHADVALIRAHRADRLGNLTYRKTARAFSPVMAAAAELTIVQADEVVPVGHIVPETVVTPHIYVSRVVACPPAAGPGGDTA